MWRLSSVQGDSSITLEPPGGVSMAATMDNSFFPASRAMSENVSSTIAMRMTDTSPAADGIHQPLYLGTSLRTYQSPDLQTLGSGADREDKGMNRRETHEGWPSGSDSQNSHHAMNNIQHQPHVAQQSRREKLRIPGSLHPSSPQSGNQSDHSAGSASVLDVRQGGTDVQAQQPENFDLPAGSLRGYTGHPNQMGDVLSVYNTNMIASDPYNFPTGAELLAFPSKGSSYLCAASDLMPQTVGGIPTNQSSGAGGYANQPGFFSKSSNWNGIGGQLGQYNPISIVGSNGIPGSSLQNGNSGAPGPIAATLLVGAGHGKDASLAFSGPNADAMQIYLMNNNYTGYSDGSTPGNMVLISPSSGASQGNQGTSGQAQQHFIGIPLTPPTTSQSSVANVSSVGNALPANFFSRVGGQAYNWRPGDELMFLPGSEATQRAKSMDQTGSSIGLSQLALAEMSEYGMRQSPLSSMLAQQQPLVQPGHALDMENSQNAAPGYGQSLSLSLSSQHPPSMPLHGVDVHQSGLNPSQDAKRSGQIVNKFASDLSHFRSPGREALAGSNFANMAHSGGAKQFYYDANSSPISSSFNFVSGSKFLKAAQQLLDENCNVGRGLKPRSMKHQNSGAWGSPNPAITSSFHREASTVEGGLKDGISSGSTIAQNGSQSVAQSTANENNETTAMLSPEERHEFEGKKTKLLAMLQEVDRRYRHYYEQMQVVIASFDSVAGAGAATPYTALALQAMSRYFRCLRDAITTQIQSTCKALGEEDITKQLTSRAPTSRLRFVDQQLRQQRAAFQQLGMLPQNAWRPQRGLPERSVSILRAWLFEHFLHPYPKDQDKIMLAKQTGLSRSQVSNWFINARVRLWKPMVEEMYQEEAREQTETGSGKVSGDGEEYHEGSGDIGTGEKTSKSDSRQEQSTGMIMSDNKLQGNSDLQKPLNGSMHTSDYVVNSSIRKTSQEVDSQVYDGGQQDGTKQGQSKKSRVGGHESDVLLPPNGDMDMDIKTDLSAVNDTDHKFSSQEREQFGIIQTADGRCFGSFEDRNFARFGNGFSSNYPGSGGGVTLTLGLRHSDNLHQQAYIGQMRADIDPGHGEYCGIYGNASMNATHISEHDSLDYQSRKHMETQLMHDFVA